jgi:hypothetical protein
VNLFDLNPEPTELAILPDLSTLLHNLTASVELPHLTTEMRLSLLSTAATFASGISDMCIKQATQLGLETL